MSDVVRPAAVAGTFYPSDRTALESLVDRLMAGAQASMPARDPVPKAVIAPHAGYMYSGAIAASAYTRLAPARGVITRVVLLGPAHRVWVDGLALAGADRFETPLGTVRTPEVELPGITTSARAHAHEHSLEVQLPFLQRVLGDVEVLPLLAGNASPESVAAVIDALWGGRETIVVVSSDLSHYHPSDRAEQLDAQSATQIEQLGPAVTHDQACGATPINGLLLTARRRGLQVECLDLRHSGDTGGPRDQVVGYGAFAFYDREGQP